MNYIANRRRYKKQRKHILNTIFVIFLLIIIIFVYFSRVFPALSVAVESYLNIEMNRKITDAAICFLNESEYENFVDITYTSENRVSGINARVKAINEARLFISKLILSQNDAVSIKNVAIPIGCLFSNEMLYARGPKLKFRVLSSDGFISRVESNFTERGINQTLFELYIVFEVNIMLSMPLRTITIPVSAKYLLCEAVIVGEVPEAYTDINRTFDDITESEIDDINDFGAQL